MCVHLPQHPRLQDAVRRHQPGDHPREHRGWVTWAGPMRHRVHSGPCYGVCTAVHATACAQRPMLQHVHCVGCSGRAVRVGHKRHSCLGAVCCTLGSVCSPGGCHRALPALLQASTRAWSTRWCPAWWSRSRWAAKLYNAMFTMLRCGQLYYIIAAGSVAPGVLKPNPCICSVVGSGGP